MKRPIQILISLLTATLLIIACSKKDSTPEPPEPTISLPILTIADIIDISENGCTTGGNVISDGNATVTARGVCWSTSQTPTITDSKTSDGTGTGEFTSSLTGLTANTTYYVRAYATNSVGTAYGDQKEFTTSSGGGVSTGTFTDARDGQTYSTIEIGSQTWMAENLAYLPSVSPSSAESYTTPYYYVYGYNGTSVNSAKATSNYNTYGVLYNWSAAMAGAASSSSNPSGVRGVCPSGWHLPSDAEWKTLEMTLGMSQSEADDSGWRGTDEGQKMKSTSGWFSNGNGTNSSGFTALPGGFRLYLGSFSNIGLYGYWWSATEGNADGAWCRYMYCSSSNVSRGSYI